MCYIDGAIQGYMFSRYPNTRVLRVNPAHVAKWFKDNYNLSWFSRAQKKQLTTKFFNETISKDPVTFDEADAYLNYVYALHKFEDLACFRKPQFGTGTDRALQRGDSPVPHPKT